MKDNYLKLNQLAVDGKTVLLRADLNVPILETQGTSIDMIDQRLRATIPTIDYLLSKGCKIVLCSHLGRPGGVVDPKLSMKPIADRLSILINKPIKCLTGCIGPDVRTTVDTMTSGELVMLENLRFHPEEEKNDSAFATELAQLADIFVLEAFGTAHRRHASIVGVPKLLPSAPGILLQSELSMLGKVLEAPTKPLAAILGGAKISDKIKILDNLLDKLDVLIIGGGMASNFLKAKGLNIGKSLVEDDGEQLARDIIKRSATLKVELSLPIDIIVGNEFKSDPETVKTVKIDEIEDDFMILDIGPKTISLFLKQLSRSKTILWNGPLGVCEFDMFSKGTKHVAKNLASLDAFSIIGGGSTASAIEELGISDQLGYISTGGAAMLEFLEGKVLPGVAALSQHSN